MGVAVLRGIHVSIMKINLKSSNCIFGIAGNTTLLTVSSNISELLQCVTRTMGNIIQLNTGSPLPPPTVPDQAFVPPLEKC